MEPLTVERSIWIEAPRERIWQALTAPEEIARWLMPPALGAQMKQDAAGTLMVCMGPMEIPVAIWETLDPPHQASSRSLPERLLTTTYTLADENNGTRVTVRLAGFEALPAEARADRLKPSSAGWEKGLANLKAHVARAELPFPEGYVAALFGYRRETQKTLSVERSIWIAAPRERVWQAITDPAQLDKWFSPGTVWSLSALDPGGRLFVRNPETGAEQYTQVIEEVNAPQRLVLRSVPEPPGQPEVTAYTLQEERGGTRLTVTHSGYELAPEESRAASMEQNAFGFGMMLANVQAHVEGRPLPYPGGF